MFSRSRDGQDSAKLFRLIRRQNGATSEPTSTLSYGGRTYPNGRLPNAWADYFPNLATPTSHKAESTSISLLWQSTVVY